MIALPVKNTPASADDYPCEDKNKLSPYAEGQFKIKNIQSSSDDGFFLPLNPAASSDDGFNLPANAPSSGDDVYRQAKS